MVERENIQRGIRLKLREKATPRRCSSAILWHYIGINPMAVTRPDGSHSRRVRGYVA
jgi:hypothetical protein